MLTAHKMITHLLREKNGKRGVECYGYGWGWVGLGSTVGTVALVRYVPKHERGVKLLR